MICIDIIVNLLSALSHEEGAQEALVAEEIAATAAT